MTEHQALELQLSALLRSPAVLGSSTPCSSLDCDTHVLKDFARQANLQIQNDSHENVINQDFLNLLAKRVKATDVSVELKKRVRNVLENQPTQITFDLSSENIEDETIELDDGTKANTKRTKKVTFQLNGMIVSTWLRKSLDTMERRKGTFPFCILCFEWDRAPQKNKIYTAEVKFPGGSYTERLYINEKRKQSTPLIAAWKQDRVRFEIAEEFLLDW